MHQDLRKCVTHRFGSPIFRAVVPKNNLQRRTLCRQKTTQALERPLTLVHGQDYKRNSRIIGIHNSPAVLEILYLLIIC
jgi:hypothetical protein